MKNLTFKLLLGIIAVNLTIQTLKDTSVFPTVHADVAGMSDSDLRRDRDFRRAVRYVVEDCNVLGSSISC